MEWPFSIQRQIYICASTISIAYLNLRFRKGWDINENGEHDVS